MRERLRIAIHGAVQGVGFRPHVFRLATSLDLDGWVMNTPEGVVIEVEGVEERLEAFLSRVERDGPPRAVIQGMDAVWLEPARLSGFVIRDSETRGATTALVLPDVATCPDCVAELFDPADRRYRYPFTNCTNCGPRFTIIDGLPYDRAKTSMRAFSMCPECRREYEDPRDRRFHAQPNACPVCGPQTALWDSSGRPVASANDAIVAAVRAIRDGAIVAVKGLGGFHLIADARRSDAVLRLRERKHRADKPFALMYPSLGKILMHCAVSSLEGRLLASPEAPIVLLDRRAGAHRPVSDAVAPGNPQLGVMLPSTPLHHLLLRDLDEPVIATSGNLSDEPICTDEHDALERLRGIADLWLVHNRPIVRHADDSIVRVVLGRELVLRRARGYAPFPVALGAGAPPMIALGAHQKNTIAITAGANAFLSQHIGDLDSPQAAGAFTRTIASLERLYDVAPQIVVADLHPDYLSTRYARTLGLPVVGVQHHEAHVAACMLEHHLEGLVLGVAWDGTGYGTDGTIWGGEFLIVGDDECRRAACLRPFRLPGGERAVREPRRSALGVLHEIGARAARVDEAFTSAARALLARALDQRLNAPVTTSAGRLFDAVASMTGLRHTTTFEGQAAMALEWAVDDAVTDAYPFAMTGLGTAGTLILDWSPLVRALLADVDADVAVSIVAARFHNTCADMIGAAAERVGIARVVLGGGCFQNGRLLTRTVSRLRAAGFQPHWPQRIPPNDGGIALGQLAACLRRRRAAERPLAAAGVEE